MKYSRRTHSCGELTSGALGEKVVLAGWARRVRDHGGVIFIDLADRDGVTQVVINPEAGPEVCRLAEKVRSEYVIEVRGEVRGRPEGTVNPRLPTGEIEVACDQLEILNPSLTPPFPISDDEDIQEETRLAYRYLDLRRPRMLRSLQLRHRVSQEVRRFLSGEGFWEVETPLLTKSTPEGARDYLVPSRIHPGRFYALPQSPQLFKQMLMVSGVDKYFQLARCLRDEDLRADRQPEHTQIDIEMSFVEADDIFLLVEGLVKEVFGRVFGIEVPTPFSRMTHREAIGRFGSDKPDTRFGLELNDVTDIFAGCGADFIRQALEGGEIVRALAVPGGSALSQSRLEALVEFCREHGAGGLIWIVFREDGTIKSPLRKQLTGETLDRLRRQLGCGPGDLALAVVGDEETASEVMGRLRLKIGRDLEMIPGDVFNFLWVHDFPLLVFDEELGRYAAVHHPFTSPKPEDIPLLDSDPLKARARAYDLVLNGTELGGGSVRIHRREIQEKMFSLLGIGPEQAQARFGFLLDALRYGAPPHGGIALGLDRLLMLAAGLESIRDVITFPKTQKAVCLTTGSPSEVSEEQLRELHIRLRGREKE